MPGVHRFFSKSVPPLTVSGRTPGCAPTRTSSSFLPSQRIAPVILKREAVKHPVLADLPAVQPHGGAELRLVDLHERKRPFPGRDKSRVVPEVIPVLVR